jgi:pimeloyl-ACP methyl ester carboxylesterase
MIRAIIACTALLLCTVSTHSSAQAAVARASATPTTPDSVTALLDWSRRAKAATRRNRPAIDTTIGIDALTTIELNGIKHVISIRGTDRKNPVLLFVHGGPRDPIMPESHLFQSPLEHAFTVVQWDQRCVGKTYFANLATADCSKSTYALMYSDLEQMVEALRDRFGGRRIAVLGHSWGTMIGTPLARRRPELLSVYVGVGQVTSLRDMAAFTLAELIREATARGDQELLTMLQSTRIYPRDSDQVLAGRREITLGMHRYGWSYRGGGRYTDYGDGLIDLVMKSPEYSLLDATYFTQYKAMELYSVLQSPPYDVRSLGGDFAVPLVIGMGSHDLHTPYALVQ